MVKKKAAFPLPMKINMLDLHQIKARSMLPFCGMEGENGGPSSIPCLIIHEQKGGRKDCFVW